MFSTKLFFGFIAFFSAASAASISPLLSRPLITSPKAGDVWLVGSVQTITWETDKIPPLDQNTTGHVVLGFIETDDPSGNEHLNMTLASGFPIVSGAVNVTVPDVETRNDYTVVLFGDSGDASPLFTITN